MNALKNLVVAAACWSLVVQGADPAPAAAPAPRFRGPQGPQFVSPEVASDRRVTFRVLAPQAQAVRLTGSDIPGLGQGAALTKGTAYLFAPPLLLVWLLGPLSGVADRVRAL